MTTDSTERPSPRPAWRRRLGILALVAGLILTSVFALRAWRQYAYAQRIAAGEIQVESLRGWMTLAYIAHLYDIPEADVRATLGIAASGGDDRSLRDWLGSSDVDALTRRQRLETLILQRQRSGEVKRD